MLNYPIFMSAKSNTNQYAWLSKKKQQDIVPESDDSDSSSDDEPAVKGPEKLTMKNLIRTLHIKDPGHHVMGILGKLYPKSEKEFKLTRLDGSWLAYHLVECVWVKILSSS